MRQVLRGSQEEMYAQQKSKEVMLHERGNPGSRCHPGSLGRRPPRRNESVYISGVLEYGAAGYVTKDESPEKLVEAIYRVAGGHDKVFSRKVKNTIKDKIDS